MAYKILAGIVAAGLMLAFISPVALRLKDTALWIVVALGIGMMLVDLWQSLTSKDE